MVHFQYTRPTYLAVMSAIRLKIRNKYLAVKTEFAKSIVAFFVFLDCSEVNHSLT